MVAVQRHAREHRLRPTGRDSAGADGVADDLVVGLGVDVALVDRHPDAALVALGLGLAEAGDLVGLAVAVRILERDEEAPGRGRAIGVVLAAPGVGVEHPAGTERQVAQMAEVVGEDRGAEAGRQGDAPVVAAASRRGVMRGGLVGGGRVRGIGRHARGGQGRPQGEAEAPCAESGFRCHGAAPVRAAFEGARQCGRGPRGSMRKGLGSLSFRAGSRR